MAWSFCLRLQHRTPSQHYENNRNLDEKKLSRALPAFDHAAVNLMEKYVYCISITAFGQCKILSLPHRNQDMKYSW
jgi:hypothetical protein